ncbi:MAG TPA: DUF6265 family protein [Chitinophagaceae bacterium]
MKVYKQPFNLKAVFILVITVSIAACNNESNNTVDDAGSKTDTAAVAGKQLVFDKIAGTWQSEDGKSFERWIKNEDGSFQTTVFSIKGADTSWIESGKVYPENGQWVFENTVKDQNDGKPVKFVSSSLSENSVQFSNPAHDFPTDINYTLPDAKTINAFIVGPNDKGGKDTIPYNFKRVE